MALSLQTVSAGTDFDAATEGAGTLTFDACQYGEFIHVRSCRFHGKAGGPTSWLLLAVSPDDADNKVVLLVGTTEEDWTFEDFTLPVTADGTPFVLALLTVGLAVESWWTIDYTVKVEGTR